MLKDKNNDKLTHRGIEEQFHLFYQLWSELLCTKTLDTYQYRVFYSINALKELITVIENRLNGFYQTNDNVEVCQKECLELVKNDYVIKTYYIHEYSLLLKYFGKRRETPAEQKTLKHQISVIIAKMQSNYFNYLVCSLYEAISLHNSSLVVSLTNILVSYCINIGWSTKALENKLQVFRTNSAPEEKWTTFIDSINHSAQSEYCILINLFLKSSVLNMEQITEILADFDVMTKDYTTLCTEYSFAANKLKNRTYMAVNITAFDIYSATMQSLNKISEALNMLSFYNLISEWNIKDIKFIALDFSRLSAKLILPSDLYGTYDYLDSSSKIFEYTKHIFSNPYQKKLQNKLRGVFGYANISKNSLFQEEKYMNIWVALESLARTDLCPNIISNVLENVPSALCIRYIYRLTRNFCEDLNRCDITLADFQIDINQEEKQELVFKVIDLFRSADYASLLSKCSINSLLHYRCEDIHKLLTDLSYAWSRIKMHHDKIDWQLQRLYRIRNEIAHSALQEKASLLIYIEHLFDYLSTFVSEIVTRVGSESIISIEEVLMIIQGNYIELASICSDKKSNLIIEDVLPRGIIELI